jgi:hypothetical protein
MVSKPVSKSGPPLEEQFICPGCKTASIRSQWRVVFRHIRGAPGKPPARVLRHNACNEIVYFLLE